MIRLCSFSYKNGPLPDPLKWPVRIDCRAIRNPLHEPELRMLTGLRGEVQRYVMGDPKAERIVREVVTSARAGEDRSLAFGCVGGKHRSVSVVEQIAKQVSEAGVRVFIEHLSLGTNREIIP